MLRVQKPAACRRSLRQSALVCVVTVLNLTFGPASSLAGLDDLASVERFTGMETVLARGFLSQGGMSAGLMLVVAQSPGLSLGSSGAEMAWFEVVVQTADFQSCRGSFFPGDLPISEGDPSGNLRFHATCLGDVVLMLNAVGQQEPWARLSADAVRGGEVPHREWHVDIDACEVAPANISGTAGPYSVSGVSPEQGVTEPYVWMARRSTGEIRREFDLSVQPITACL